MYMQIRMLASHQKIARIRMMKNLRRYSILQINYLLKKLMLKKYILYNMHKHINLMRSYQVLSFRFRVNLGVMAMKG